MGAERVHGVDGRGSIRGLRYHAPAARALYLHIPFCVKKCAYCDFASWATPHGTPILKHYAHALAWLVDDAGYAGLLDEAVTAYIGGGTPTMLGEWLAPLVEAVTRWVDVRELSVEANPESVDAQRLLELGSVGATRISIGVQSLVSAELRSLGRIHGVERARKALAEAVAAGFDVSADLICGIPGQTAESWRRSVEGVLSAGVGHLSVYPLSIEEGTPLARRIVLGKAKPPDEDLQALLMEDAARIASAHGMERYEVASYAAPSKESRHNLAYWTAQPYLGLGTGAASMLTREAYGRLRAIAPQLPALSPDTARVRLTMSADRHQIVLSHRISGLPFEVEELGMRQAVAEDLMLAARMSAGIDDGLAGLAREVLGAARVDAALDGLVNRGLLAAGEGGSFAPTHAGWLLGNELYGVLWSLAD